MPAARTMARIPFLSGRGREVQAAATSARSAGSPAACEAICESAPLLTNEDGLFNWVRVLVRQPICESVGLGVRVKPGFLGRQPNFVRSVTLQFIEHAANSGFVVVSECLNRRSTNLL